jgi:hypothetical protein
MSLELGNQTLGRGKVLFSKFQTGTFTPEGFRYLGNSPSFSINMAQQKLDHFSSDTGVRVKDKSIVLQVDITGNLVLDDINFQNLELFFFGSSSVIAQTSATSQTQTFTNVQTGFGYRLGMTGNNPTGVRSISNVSVTSNTTARTLGTDYTVDAERGIIYPVEGGGIADGHTMVVTYNRAAVSRRQFISGTTQIEGALMFQADNPQGQKNDFYMPYVRLGPNGDFNLKADEWQQLPLQAEILANTAVIPSQAAIYCDGVPYA